MESKKSAYTRKEAERLLEGESRYGGNDYPCRLLLKREDVEKLKKSLASTELRGVYWSDSKQAYQPVKVKVAEVARLVFAPDPPIYKHHLPVFWSSEETECDFPARNLQGWSQYHQGLQNAFD